MNNKILLLATAATIATSAQAASILDSGLSPEEKKLNAAKLAAEKLLKAKALEKQMQAHALMQEKVDNIKLEVTLLKKFGKDILGTNLEGLRSHFGLTCNMFSEVE